MAKMKESAIQKTERAVETLSMQQQQSLGVVNQEQSRAIAEVQAALVIAKRFPRDVIKSRDRIMQACARKEFAELATYEYARGGTSIEGPSIRLAEEFARSFGNIISGVTELVRHEGLSECLAYAWDLETNYKDEKRFSVRHWRDTKSGGYLLEDERDIYELIANMGARRKRACILAVIPADVQDDALKQCDETLKNEVKVTTESIKAMLEKFGGLGVTKEAIEKRIQRRSESITSGQMLQMRKIYNSITDGMSGPADWFDMEQSQTDKVIDKVDKKAEPKSRPKPQPKADEQVPATMFPEGNFGEDKVAAIRKGIDGAKTNDDLIDIYNQDIQIARSKQHITEKQYDDLCSYMKKRGEDFDKEKKR